MKRLISLSLFLMTGAAFGAEAAATAAPAAPAAPPIRVEGREVTDLLERFVSWLHHFFPAVDDGLFHWIACGVLFIAAILLRHLITNVIFFYLKKLAEKTETTLDDKLFPALESPAATLVMVLGIFASLTVLQLSEQVDRLISNGALIAILSVLLWGVVRAGGAILDHLEEIAHERKMTVATFMPLIKKTLFVMTVVIGIIIIADSLGAKVGALLTSLGIGGLAFALAAQDTIANLFGSFVVVVDQPFKVGDAVKIGSNTGTVEDIGLRSTKIRLLDRSLVVLPNKSVAAEAIVNLSRFTGRRVEQTIGLTYDTRPEQMEGILEDLRQLISRDPEVDPSSVVVFFSNFSASSLDIQVIYTTVGSDGLASLRLKERLNLAIMRAVSARGLAFAFPTQTMHLSDQLVERLRPRA
ncbi:MAG TPA: mechanosensitive ion channel family protein [Opitutaceae bacterium]|nr:mechanosensitive ion channel family protein [Opitutaceae bacterium]HND60631.1 mechanosensitive ion channel family protein [Opitutaceae bacterium]